MTRISGSRAILASLLLPSLAHAQWSSDPAVNLALADASGDQVQPKIAPTADGGCYVSWFDNIANGFDVRLQRLDAAGIEQWPHNGVLVADRGFSSTQDYGLDVDASGNALLAFRCDSTGSTQAHASKVAPDGTLLWGANGIALTSTTDFIGAPAIAGTSAGHAVVGWTQNADAVLQRLDGAGTPQWGPVVLSPSSGFFSVADVQDAGADAIVSIVNQTGPTPSFPKHLVAQKLDSTGAPLWGANPVAVFDGGSLQIGNFPDFESDGSGGAVFSWYGISPLQCFVQRILANGSEAFAHDGVPVSTDATRVRVSPSASYDPGTGDTYVFWTEMNSTQSMRGVWGQKVDASGARQWTAEGATVVALGSNDISWVRTVQTGSGAFAFWEASPSFGNDTLHGTHLDSSGSTTIAVFDVASTPSGKSRLEARRVATGHVVLAWMDDRSDANDVLAQNVAPDGSLGVDAIGTRYCDPAVPNSTGNPGVMTVLGSATVADDFLVLLASDLPTNSNIGYFLMGTGTNTFTPPGSAGPICIAPGLKRYLPPVNHTDQLPGGFSRSVGTSGPVSGVITPSSTWNFQAWHRDSNAGTSNLTDAVNVSFL